MKKFDRFIDITRALFKPDHPLRTFHTTFAIRGKKVVSIGVNTNKSHPKTLRYDYHDGCPGTHSELSAIIKLGTEDCSDVTFVNVRLLKDQTVVNSKPCRGCTHLMQQVGYKKFYYSTTAGTFTQL